MTRDDALALYRAGEETVVRVRNDDYAELRAELPDGLPPVRADALVLPGDGASVQVTYSYTWAPSESVLAAWEAQRAAAVATLTEELLTQQFEKNKALITEKSKIKSRPANDLRQEERYEVMNRMVSYLFGRGDDPSEPTPLAPAFATGWTASGSRSYTTMRWPPPIRSWCRCSVNSSRSKGSASSCTPSNRSRTPSIPS